MDDHLVAGHIERDIRHVQKVVREVLFDHITFVTEADHEVMDPIMGINFHDVPQDRTPANLDHRFGAQRRLFTDAGTETAREDYGFHRGSLLKVVTAVISQSSDGRIGPGIGPA